MDPLVKALPRANGDLSIYICKALAQIGDHKAVKLLCGFEPEEMVRLGGKEYKAEPMDNLYWSKPPATPISGVAVFNGRGYLPYSPTHYRLVKAHATEGQYAIVNRSFGSSKPGARFGGGAGIHNIGTRLLGMD